MSALTRLGVHVRLSGSEGGALVAVPGTGAAATGAAVPAAGAVAPAAGAVAPASGAVAPVAPGAGDAMECGAPADGADIGDMEDPSWDANPKRVFQAEVKRVSASKPHQTRSKKGIRTRMGCNVRPDNADANKKQQHSERNAMPC